MSASPNRIRLIGYSVLLLIGASIICYSLGYSHGKKTGWYGGQYSLRMQTLEDLGVVDQLMETGDIKGARERIAIMKERNSTTDEMTPFVLA